MPSSQLAMVAQTTPAHAPLNDAFKYFIANIDFYTTAAQVEEFFSQFGKVNHVKLLPPQPGSSSGSSTSGSGTKGEQKQLHRGYGFLFMLDEESCVNVDQYVSSFPENKIIMLGRKGVHVKRQLGMGGRGYNDYNNTSNGWNGNNAGGAGNNNQYHSSWAQYYGGTPYNAINHQNPQQMAYYPANYYTSPTPTITVGPAGQAQPYSQPAMVSYTQPQQQQQQYPTDANYAGSVYVPPQTTTPNQIVPPSHQQQQQLLPPHYDPLYTNPQIMHHHQQQPPYQTQPPPPPPIMQQQQHQHLHPPLPVQQQHPQQAYGGGPNIRTPIPPNNNNNWGPGPMNGGGRGSGEGGGGGKWQQHQDNRGRGGGGGGGRGLNSSGSGRGGGGGGGRNGRDGRMDRPY